VSGVIFAIIGWSVVRDRLSTRALGSAGWRALVAGLVYTFLVPHVSIGGHLGGLAAGLALAWAFERGEARGLEPQPGSRPVSA
jgi:membrane associated rhomboid family serine protease